MADALCGPSNPLQSFQKHTNVDRTLQQDRLVTRHSPSQGFRSSPGPSAGSLDPEFEAFQAGIPAGPLPHELQQFPHQPLPLHTTEAPPQLSDWASDFQRLHLSPQSHSPVPISSPRAQSHKQSPAAWHQDFLQQHQQQHHPSAASPQIQQPAFRHNAFSSVPSYSMPQPVTSFYEPSFAERPDMTIAQGKQKEQVAEMQWDDAAFERAFDAVQKDILSTEEDFAEAFQKDLKDVGAQLDSQNTDSLIQQDFSAVIEDSARGDMDADIQRFKDQIHDDPLADQHDILDAIEAEALARQRFEEERRQEEIHDMRPPDLEADDLSRTAGELLDSVSHDTSKKFQESNFLALMRRLRDREVRVEGDQMVEVRDSSSTSFLSSTTSTPVSALSAASSEPVSTASSNTSVASEEVAQENMATPKMPPQDSPMWIDWIDAEGRRHVHPAPPVDEQCKLYGCSITNGHLHDTTVVDTNSDSDFY